MRGLACGLGGGHKGREMNTREKNREVHTHSGNVQGCHSASLILFREKSLNLGGERKRRKKRRIEEELTLQHSPKILLN